MKLKSLAAIAISLSAVTGSFFLGKSLASVNKETKRNDEGKETVLVSNLPLINPFIDCIEKNRLSFNRLSPFKKNIEQYLAEIKSRNAKITVSYCFLDLNSGMRIVKGENEKYSPASLMKVPTMIAVLKRAELDPSILGHKVQYIESNIRLTEESGFPKANGNYYTVNELLIQSIQFSDNAATFMLREFAGKDSIAKVEDDLGIHVGNNMSSDDNFMTVEQFAEILNVLYQCDYLNTEMSQLALNLLVGVKYEQGIRKMIPVEIPVAQKYGKRFGQHLNNIDGGQLHQFGVVYCPGRPFIIGVMTKGGGELEKEEIVEELSRITFEEVKKQTHVDGHKRNRMAMLNININKAVHSINIR